jgi:hypothetical protein
MSHHEVGDHHRFVFIARGINGNVGNRTEDGDIFGGVMRHAQSAIGITPADRDDFDIGPTISGIISDLFKTAKHRKVTNGIANDLLAR